MKTIKYFAFTILLSLVNILSASAYDFEVDGIYYTIGSKENKTCSVTYKDANYNSYSGEIVIPTVVNGYTVTAISFNAFTSCSNLTSLTIPNSVTTIGHYAFQNCSNLTNIEIPNSVTTIESYAFSGCSSLTNIEIPSSVTTLGYVTFSDCTALTSIEIPNSVTKIGWSTFQNCSSLTSVTIPASVNSIEMLAFFGCTNLSQITCLAVIPPSGDYPVCDNKSCCVYVPQESIGAYKVASAWRSLDIFAIGDLGFVVDGIKYYVQNGSTNACVIANNYAGDIVIPEEVQYEGDTYRVTTIADRAFKDCRNLTSLVLPNSVTAIGNSAFEGCSSLTSINIPENITTIEERTFADCRSLISIEIPDGVTTIGEWAFQNCSSLTSIDIPDNVTSIEKYIFYGCTNLVSVTIPNGVITIGEYAFQNCSSLISIDIPESVTTIGYFAFYNCSSLTSIEIPNGVTTIGERAFQNCSSLISINIPDNVTSIEKNTFSGCTNLVSVSIPNGVTTIGERAFQNCSSLISIDIPDNVTSIEKYTFYGCTNLVSVTIPNGVTTIGEYAFQNCTNLSQITCLAVIPPSCNWSFLNVNVKDCNIYVPEESINAYKDVDIWKSFNIFTIGDLAFVVDGVKYFVQNGSTNVCVIANNYSGDIVIPEEVQYNEQTYHVTTIVERAFLSCTDLVSVTIPNSVTTIGEFAFLGCHSLTTINIPENITTIEERTFAYCSSLTSIEIPDGVTTIGNFAFSGCSSLVSITIPNSVTSIGSSAFSFCSNLASLTIPNTITSIGTQVFYECSKLTSVEISNSVTKIEYGTFFGCNSLASVTIPASVKSIGGAVFEGCANLSQITCLATTPSSCESWTFQGLDTSCTIYVPHASVESYKTADYWKDYNILAIGSSEPLPLRFVVDGIRYVVQGDGREVRVIANNYAGDIVIPSEVQYENQIYSVTTIGNSAFSGCWNLSSLTIPNSVKTIGDHAFEHCGFSCIEIPNSVTTIGDYAFEGCGSLVSIELPNGITTMGQSPFQNCTSLTSIEIPNSVTKIEWGTFMNCSSLTSVTIPASVRTIDYHVFERCTNLSQIICLATIPPSCNSNTFYGLDSSCTIYVPQDFVEEYKTANYWKGYNILAIGESAPLHFTVNGIKYVVQGDGTEVRVVANNYAGDIVIPSEVEYEGETYRVTTIGDRVFADCYNLTSLVLPNSVTTIGNYTFYRCSNLISIELSNGLTTLGQSPFQNCTSLTSIEIPNSVTKIEWGTFYNCSSLASVTIPASVTTIEGSIFDGCTNLSQITCLATTPPSCKSWTFSGLGTSCTIYVPQESVEAYKTADCWKEFNILAIGESEPLRFMVDGIKYVVQGGGTEVCVTANNYAGDIVIPSEVQYEGEAYRVTSIGNSAFYSCRNLSSIIIPNSVTTIGDFVFMDCSTLTSIEFPNSVMKIGNFAFNGCSSLVSIKLSNNLTTLGQSPFQNCTSLASIEIPNSVTKIEWGTFLRCSSLISVTIPASVTTIGNGVFEECTGLASVKILADLTNLEFDFDLFRNVDLSNATLYTLDKYLDDYRTTYPWSEFGHFESIPSTITLAENGAPFDLTEAIEHVDVTYTRNFTHTNWQPLYIPFNISYEEWAPYAEVAKINGVHQYDYNDDGVFDETIIEFRKITHGELTANTPYVIKPKVTGAVDFICQDKTLEPPVNGDGYVWCASSEQIYTLTGNHEPKTDMAGVYALARGTFYRGTATSPALPANSIYLTIEDKSYSNLRGANQGLDEIKIRVLGEDTTTSTETIHVESPDQKALYYDLWGRPIANPTQGIYIHNGKKVFIKK